MSSRNFVKNVAVVGATGTVGKPIVQELLRLGNHEITAITRKDSPAANSVPATVKVAKVDYDDESTLVDALRGIDALVITMKSRAPPEIQLKLVRAAAAANVPFVLPNEWGCDLADEVLAKDILLGEAEGHARKLIQDLGKSSWIGVVTGFWYELSLALGRNTYGMDWKNRTWTFFDDGETKMHTVTTPQTGRAVAKLLSLPIEPEKEGSLSLSKYKNRYIYVSSFLLSQKDMFASVLRVTGTKESDWKIEYEGCQKRFEEAQKRVFAGDTSFYQQLLYSRTFRDGGNNFERRGGLANDLLGLPNEELDEWTKVAIGLAENDVQYN